MGMAQYNEPGHGRQGDKKNQLDGIAESVTHRLHVPGRRLPGESGRMATDMEIANMPKGNCTRRSA